MASETMATLPCNIMDAAAALSVDFLTFKRRAIVYNPLA
jgi:hypothetical protein